MQWLEHSDTIAPKRCCGSSICLHYKSATRRSLLTFLAQQQILNTAARCHVTTHPQAMSPGPSQVLLSLILRDISPPQHEPISTGAKLVDAHHRNCHVTTRYLVATPPIDSIAKICTMSDQLAHLASSINMANCHVTTAYPLSAIIWLNKASHCYRCSKKSFGRVKFQNLVTSTTLESSR